MSKRFAIVSNTADLGVLVVRNLLIKLVREREPNANIAILADPEVVEKTRDFYRRHSWVDECISLDARRTRAQSSQIRLIQLIKKKRFDCMILSPESKFPSRIPYLCNVATRVGFASSAIQRKYLNRPVSLPANVEVKDLHWTEILSGYVQALGIKTFRGAGYHVPFFRVEETNPTLANPRLISVVVHVGGNAEWNRRWPLVNFQRLCSRMTNTRAISLTLIGGVGEVQENNTIVEAVKKENPTAAIKSLAGQTLAQTALAIKHAQLFVGNDSGPMNMAVALGIPVVAIRGADPENFRADRVDPKHIVISNWQNCARCIENSHMCGRGCPVEYDRASQRYPLCMEAIPFERVWSAVQQQLKTIDIHQNDYTGVTT